ncbi:MAG: Spore coat assembly protein-like protein, partial [Candidatus Solibacter sp.]|nr:Spore coat assembly protein-like protein [Candidatus Solibacter sp.]
MGGSRFTRIRTTIGTAVVCLEPKVAGNRSLRPASPARGIARCLLHRGVPDPADLALSSLGGIAVALRKYLFLLAAFFACLSLATAQTPTTTELFDDSVVHEIRITMPAANWSGLQAHYLDNTYFNVDSLQWKGAGSNTFTVSNLQVRSRGHGSRTPIKPSLHVNINNNVATQTFLGLTEFDLKGNAQDASLIHERISMKLFTRMGVPASREVAVRVYVNNAYIGLYNLVESPNAQMLRRLFNENNGYLYEYKPGDWTGVPGAGYHFEYLGSNLDVYSSSTTPTPFDPQTPHTNSPDTVTLEAWIRTMNEASDADFLTKLTPFLDPKPFLTQVAVETYLADFDCILGDSFGLNNFFLYRFQNKQLNIFIAWDKDNAFDWAQRPVLQNANQNVLMRRLMAIPEMKKYYLEAVVKTAMLAGGAGGWMQQEATSEYAQIKQAAYD